MKKLFFFLLMTAALAACTHQNPAWQGFYYPSGSAEDGFETQSFVSNEACENWTFEKMGNETTEGEHSYCGYNCSYDDEGQYGCEL
ncbi:membrane lipoprotein lipid attachment site-containing protein [Candidatus Peregrinibacteria bacterium]|nr:MAG: membrane lipoprotein lipid attachment site-containing protein [Candidatus Peregrinibacteria bacterium]